MQDFKKFKRFAKKNQKTIIGDCKIYLKKDRIKYPLIRYPKAQKTVRK